MNALRRIFPLLAGLALAARAESADPLPGSLDALDAADPQLATKLETLAAGIARNPEAAAAALLPALENPKAAAEHLVFYAWAAGVTHSERVVAPLGRILDRRGIPDALERACLTALAETGRPAAGELLMQRLGKTDNADRRFILLDHLAQMKHKPAIPDALKLLEESPDARDYWRPLLVFGKFGADAAPALRERLGDGKRNVRMNAVLLLGRWLRDAESAPALRGRFAVEKDPELRRMLLAGLEATVTDPAELKTFVQGAAATEKDKKVRTFAREMAAELDGMAEAAAAARGKRKPDPDAFAREYDALWRSWGAQGDLKTLKKAGTPADAPRLRLLRERILQRNTGAAFPAYEGVNDILSWYRLLEGNAKP
jgi:hypothetical protein